MIHLDSSTKPKNTAVSVVIALKPEDLRFLQRVAKNEDTGLSELLISSAKLRYLHMYPGPKVQLPASVAEKLFLPPPAGV